MIEGAEAGRYAGFLLATAPALAAAPLAPGRLGCLDAALAAAPREGIGLEFGVWHGRSLRRIARRQPWRRFHGFDSLQGFPDDGRPDWRLDFHVARPPRLPRNCTFHAGFFAETVPAFAAALREPIAFVNLDCDILSAAEQALGGLLGRLGPGTTMHLDEAVNYDTWLWNEMLELFRFLDTADLDIAWIARGGRIRDLPTTLRFQEAGGYPRWEDDVAAGYARQAAGRLVARADAWRTAPPDIARRLLALSRAHWQRTLARQPCHPEDPLAPPPPPRPAWRRWLGF